MNNGKYLTPAFELSLKVYNRVFQLATNANMTDDQKEEYESVLEEQPQIIAQNLKEQMNIGAGTHQFNMY